MTAILVLAAGRGSRLAPYSDDRPKCLLEFAGKSLLAWQLAALAEVGLEDVSIVTGYRREAFAPYGLRTYDNPRWNSTNMVHSLLCARPLLETAPDLLVCYGDVIYQPDVAARLLAEPAEIAVAVNTRWRSLWTRRFQDPSLDAESMELAADGRILDLGRPLHSSELPQAQYAGLLRLNRRGLDHLLRLHDRVEQVIGQAADPPPWLMGRTLHECYLTDFLRGLIDSGAEVKGVPFPGGWLEFDTGADLELYTAMHRSHELAEHLTLW